MKRRAVLVMPGSGKRLPGTVTRRRSKDVRLFGDMEIYKLIFTSDDKRIKESCTLDGWMYHYNTDKTKHDHLEFEQSVTLEKFFEL